MKFSRKPSRPNRRRNVAIFCILLYNIEMRIKNSQGVEIIGEFYKCTIPYQGTDSSKEDIVFYVPIDKADQYAKFISSIIWFESEEIN